MRTMVNFLLVGVSIFQIYGIWCFVRWLKLRFFKRKLILSRSEVKNTKPSKDLKIALFSSILTIVALYLDEIF